MFNLNLSFLQNIKNLINPFYKNKDLKFIFKKLQDGTPQDQKVARFVGGCVRKYLSNDKIDDIDIASTLTTSEIKEKFKNTNFKVIDTGIKHGTVTLVSNQFKLEVTTLRKDIDTDGRHAEVEYTDNWQLDSERRDFTINAIYLDINGNIFDSNFKLGSHISSNLRIAKGNRSLSCNVIFLVSISLANSSK